MKFCLFWAIISCIAGHGRLLAARQLELETVPVIRFEHLTEAQVRAFCLADNRIAENAGWEEDLLRVELEDAICQRPQAEL